MKNNEYEVGEWFFIAEDDEETADILKNKKPNNAYYHYSQAVEKYLKGYLSANNLSVNKNHNISQTLWTCINHNQSFVEIQKDCNKMTQAIKKIRYPGGIPATEEDVDFACNLVKKIKILQPIQQLYNSLIEKYGTDWKQALFKKIATIEAIISYKNKLEPESRV